MHYGYAAEVYKRLLVLQRKCDQYWPTDGMEIYGNMAVKLLSTVQRAHYTVNMFSLRNMKVKKVCMQLISVPLFSYAAGVVLFGFGTQMQ